MNITAIAAQLLTHLPKEQRNIPDSVEYPGCNGAVMAAMNGALQELFTGSAPWVRKDERGAQLHAPATVQIAVVAGSNAGTITDATWQAWFSGCSIIIDGASVTNQIRNDSKAVVLKFPHDGTTGTKTATVYQTSVDAATDVMSVHAPVRVNGREVFPRSDPRAAPRLGCRHDFGFASVPSNLPGVEVGSPMFYETGTWSPNAVLAPVTRIRLLPAPAVAGFIEYTGKLAPPSITSLASTDLLPIPLQFVESIFLPVAVQRLTASPFFLDSGRTDEIARAYKQALLDLKALTPAANSGLRITASCSH